MSPLQLKFWTQLLTIPEVPISAIRSLLHNALHVYFPCQYWPIEQSIAQFKNDLYFPTCINWKHSAHDMKNPYIKNTLYSYVKKMFNFLKSFIHNALPSTNRTEIQTIITWHKKLENGKVKWYCQMTSIQFKISGCNAGLYFTTKCCKILAMNSKS